MNNLEITLSSIKLWFNDKEIKPLVYMGYCFRAAFESISGSMTLFDILIIYL